MLHEMNQERFSSFILSDKVLQDFLGEGLARDSRSYAYLNSEQ